VRLLVLRGSRARRFSAVPPFAGAIYRQKMMAGWRGKWSGYPMGQPNSVTWVSSCGGRRAGTLPGIANNLLAGDLYVEMTFLKTLDTYGLDVSAHRQYDFANSEYELWHANNAGRENLPRHRHQTRVILSTMDIPTTSTTRLSRILRG
jgi:hypothetical protein